MAVNDLKYRGFKWTVGDASLPALAVLVPSDSRNLHIASASDAGTDWNLANPSHPALYIHSETTPATDYISLTHDGTAATLTVGGGNLVLAPDGSSGITISDDVLLGFGTGSTARISYDTTDANANELLIQLPAGDATDVPVIVIGQSIESVDLGLYNGVVDPRIALFGVGAVTTAPVLEFRKARGTVAAPTVVTTGDDLGTLDFYGCVAAGEYVRAASIRADMAGTIATTRGPGTITFLTATDAAPSVLTAALTLNADQSTTFGGSLVIADDALVGIGTGSTARISWDTTDANANELLIQLPAGGGTDVPVIVIGQSIESVDLGLYNGVTEPRIAMFGVGAVTTGPVIEFRKARGTVAAPTVATSGDDLGSLDFYGAVAAGEYVRSASIRADIAGTIATTRGPGTLTFLTATDAAPSVLTAALTLGANQSATFAGTVALGANNLTLTGTISATGARVTQSYHTNITSTNAVTVDSSETVKTDIAPYKADALAALRAMDVITFKHQAGLDPSQRTKLGIRAESVREDMAIDPIAGEHGEYPGVNLYALAAMQTRAIQQLLERIDRLESRKRIN